MLQLHTQTQQTNKNSWFTSRASTNCLSRDNLTSYYFLLKQTKKNYVERRKMPQLHPKNAAITTKATKKQTKTGDLLPRQAPIASQEIILLLIIFIETNKKSN